MIHRSSPWVGGRRLATAADDERPPSWSGEEPGYDLVVDLVPVPSSQMLAQLHGEPPLWSGRPDADVRFGRADLYVVPFTVLWSGFAIFWNVGVWRSSAPIPLRIFGIPFLLVGAYVLVGRFVVKKRRKERLEYAFTADRAVICDSNGGVRDVPLASTSIEQTRSRDGRHITVTFGSAVGGRWGFGTGARSMPANSGMDGFGPGSTAPAFFDVADVAGIEAALSRIRRR